MVMVIGVVVVVCGVAAVLVYFLVIRKKAAVGTAAQIVRFWIAFPVVCPRLVNEGQEQGQGQGQGLEVGISGF
jgi:hypothetical protein